MGGNGTFAAGKIVAYKYTQPGFKHGKARFATGAMIDRFGKFMKGVNLNEARKHA